MKRRAIRTLVLATAPVFPSLAHATVSTWIIGSGSANWSTAADWDTGIVPNAPGDTAQYNTGANAGSSPTTTQDSTAGVTVGTLQSFGTTDRSWIVATATGGKNVNMNNNGAGATIACTIQNTNGANAAILLTGAGAINLQDNLLISNTSNSKRSTGAIQIDPQLTGVGNITFDDENPNSTPTAGGISLYRTAPQSSNFSGSVTIKHGNVIFDRGDRFNPNPGNVINIGSAGAGNASLWVGNHSSTGGGFGAMENSFTVAANTGGTSTFGVNANVNGPVVLKSSNTNTSPWTLNGDVTFENDATNSAALLTLGDPVSGVGKITKTGANAMRISNSDSYSGGTEVSAGSLSVGNDAQFFNGFGTFAATTGRLGSGDVTVDATATKLELESGVTDAISDLATVTLTGGGTPGVADNGYMQLDTGVTETVGNLVLGGVTQPAGTYGSSASGAQFQNDEYFSGTGVLTVVGVATPEPTCLGLIGIGAMGLLKRRRK